jgi:hypothetical protein
MEALKKELIIDEAKKIKSGTFTRLCYKSELPVKAALKKQGWKVTKITQTSTRLGVNYGNIASVIARKAEESLVETVQRTNNYEWVIKNKVSYNSSTDKLYLFVARINKGSNTKSFYIVENTVSGECHIVDKLDNTEFAELIIPSYWNKGSNYPEVQRISFENVYRIGSVGENIEKTSVVV